MRASPGVRPDGVRVPVCLPWDLRSGELRGWEHLRQCVPGRVRRPGGVRVLVRLPRDLRSGELRGWQHLRQHVPRAVRWSVRVHVHVRVPRTYDPVTCEDGNTYNNSCLAQCAGQAECSSLCACPRIYDPVSCADGNTYNNACLAECAGQTACASPAVDAPGSTIR